VSPARVCGSVRSVAAGSSAIRQPAASHLSTIATCQSTPNHSTIDAASVGPTPGTAASSSKPAARSAWIDGNAAAMSGAIPLPTCRIDSATRNRANGLVFAAARLSSSLRPLALRAPAFVVKKSERSRSASVSENRSPSSTSRPAPSSASAACQPSVSMSSAARPARWNSRSRSWDGQERWLGQRMSASDSFSGRSSVPHAGQWVGITKARSVPSRNSTTGPRISGMTSPAFRRMTVSPISTPLRATSEALCSVAASTVDPATKTGSIRA